MTDLVAGNADAYLFSASTTRKVTCSIVFAHPDTRQNVSLHLRARWSGPDGKQLCDRRFWYHIKRGETESHVDADCEQDGWRQGPYLVELLSDSGTVKSASFSIVREIPEVPSPDSAHTVTPELARSPAPEAARSLLPEPAGSPTPEPNIAYMDPGSGPARGPARGRQEKRHWWWWLRPYVAPNKSGIRSSIRGGSGGGGAHGGGGKR